MMAEHDHGVVFTIMAYPYCLPKIHELFMIRILARHNLISSLLGARVGNWVAVNECSRVNDVGH
jgi:hypothetical protein